MKSRRILAAVLAPVCALSATAIVASAATTTLSEEEVVLGNWEGFYKFTADEVGELKAGDKIVVTLGEYGDTEDEKAADHFQITLQNGSWSDTGVGYEQEVVDNTVTFELTDEIIANLDEKAKEEEDGTTTYMVIKGKNATLTKAELVSEDEDQTPATPDDTTPAESTPDESTPDAVTPGATNEPGSSDQTVIKVTLKGVDSKSGLEGDKLNEALFGDTGYTWNDVETAAFTSADAFSTQFSTTGGGWFTMGKDELPATRADGDEWNTAWTIGADELAIFDTNKNDGGYVKVIAQSDGDEVKTIDIDATITIKKDAKPITSTPDDNQNTGIALAIAPVVLAGAAAAVVVVNKKRK